MAPLYTLLQCPSRSVGWQTSDNCRTSGRWWVEPCWFKIWSHRWCAVYLWEVYAACFWRLLRMLLAGAVLSLILNGTVVSMTTNVQTYQVLETLHWIHVCVAALHQPCQGGVSRGLSNLLCLLRKALKKFVLCLCLPWIPEIVLHVAVVLSHIWYFRILSADFLVLNASSTLLLVVSLQYKCTKFLRLARWLNIIPMYKQDLLMRKK